MRRIFSPGRYATVTSTLALIVALSGSAYAANTVRSTDIVDGAVKSVDIRNGGVAAIDMATSSLGRSPRLFAQIGNGGSVVRTAGVVSSAKTGTGQYTVTFIRDVSHCAVSATPFATTPVLATYQVGTSTVTVTLFDDAGSPFDSAFDVIVVC